MLTPEDLEQLKKVEQPKEEACCK
jgi:hypothetical protein